MTTFVGAALLAIGALGELRTQNVAAQTPGAGAETTRTPESRTAGSQTAGSQTAGSQTGGSQTGGVQAQGTREPGTREPGTGATPARARASEDAGARRDATSGGQVADQIIDMGRRWAALLQRHGTADGVRYAAWHRDAAGRAELEALVREVAALPVTEVPSELVPAVAVDAYNLLVVAWVLRSWPLDSVMDVPGFFDTELHVVFGERVTLNELEARWIRTWSGDPRVHFVVNCASRGCPPLQRLSYAAPSCSQCGDGGASPAAWWSRQLERATSTYLGRTVRDNGRSIELSRVFEWYAEDFGDDAAVRAFVARYVHGGLRARVLDPAVPLTYREWDWSLNDAGEVPGRR